MKLKLRTRTATDADDGGEIVGGRTKRGMVVPDRHATNEEEKS